jgi:hypothetical protein
MTGIGRQVGPRPSEQRDVTRSDSVEPPGEPTDFPPATEPGGHRSLDRTRYLARSHRMDGHVGT